jgi:hypothetical protein
LVTADPRRGTIEVNWTQSTSSVGVLKIEWKDRRTRSVIDSLSIFPEDNCTYSKVDTGRPNDRVYYLQYGNASDRRFFFWMQDKEEGNLDEENCVKINTYMSDPEEAASVATGQPKKMKKREEEEESKSDLKKSSTNGSSAAVDQSGALDSDALMSIMQGLNATTQEGTNRNDSLNGSGQVDALSNILQSLGMPQQPSPSVTSHPSSTVEGTTSSTPAPNNIAVTPSAPAPKAAPSIGLTLSDLQGAMAGLATTSPPSVPPSNNLGRPGPSLAEVVTPDAVIEAGILENAELKERLIGLLPENQRTEDRLLENLRSPQVRQCLQSLTAALCDGESLDGFHSILANFQLRPEDGAVGLSQGNPIQAFLDCVLKSVQRETEEETNETKDQE